MKPSRLNFKSNTPEEALNEALRFLGPRARSEAQISEHLKNQGYSPSLTLQILEKLCASRYAGDPSFARDWARQRAEDRGYGPRRIEQELRAKGIDESLILETLREIFAGNYESVKAKEILHKQFAREKLDDPRILRRAAAFLQRRGYSETVIQRVLRQYED